MNGLCNGVGEDEFTFTAECKTPELIWNDGMATQFRAEVNGQLEALYTKQLENAAAIPVSSFPPRSPRRPCSTALPAQLARGSRSVWKFCG